MMTKISFGEWLRQVEHSISGTIAGCRRRYWQEDHITMSWLAALMRFPSSLVLTDVPSPWAIGWDAYKADGALEEEHGDIAFIVRVTFQTGQATTGVAFLEAKRIYDGGDYRALKWPQLEYQSSRSANHRLLIYDDKTIDQATRNLLSHGYCRACFPTPFEAVHAAVVSTPHALGLRRNNRDLNNLSLPLSYQICCRYLRGLDLDFSRHLVEAVKNGVIDGIHYLVLAHAVEGAEREPSVQAMEVNTRHMIRIATMEREGPIPEG